MRILHISSEKSWRGGEQQIAYLIHEAVAEGVQSEVLCRAGSAFEKWCQENEVYHFSKGFSGIGIFTTALFLKKTSSHYDIVHAHTAKAQIVVFFALLFGMKTPVVLSRRVDFVPSRSYMTRWRYNHPGIQRIICVSDAIRKIMKTYVATGKERCVTVHSGIDLNKFDIFSVISIREQYHIPSGASIVGNTSALADHKDYYTFLDTAKRIISHKPTVHFLIMGSGPLEKEIKAYATQLGLDSHITFTGFISNVPEILPHLDVFLMTSKTEGLGTSILDAFASGVPVVATRAGGIPELVEHGVTGLMAEVKDSTTLTEHVFNLLKNPELSDKLTSNAKIKLRQFTKEHMASKTVNIYREVINGAS